MGRMRDMQIDIARKRDRLKERQIEIGRKRDRDYNERLRERKIDRLDLLNVRDILSGRCLYEIEVG